MREAMFARYRGLAQLELARALCKMEGLAGEDLVEVVRFEKGGDIENT